MHQRPASPSHVGARQMRERKQSIALLATRCDLPNNSQWPCRLEPRAYTGRLVRSNDLMRESLGKSYSHTESGNKYRG
ncbi:hypothetical protein BDV96DRAFT_561430 [Lophiotrema nucula]|uniref:Uncharacterized protein n=1 Tax=Lophiotrema nucula TaxID=690887 RepID=A0A6A5ZWR2_9PLEO|nr:hypothetical protein BDV96DRAFT_561430 [Lophiotrema nucula]